MYCCTMYASACCDDVNISANTEVNPYRLRTIISPAVVLLPIANLAQLIEQEDSSALCFTDLNTSAPNPKVLPAS